MSIDLELNSLASIRWPLCMNPCTNLYVQTYARNLNMIRVGIIYAYSRNPKCTLYESPNMNPNMNTLRILYDSLHASYMNRQNN